MKGSDNCNIRVFQPFGNRTKAKLQEDKGIKSGLSGLGIGSGWNVDAA